VGEALALVNYTWLFSPVAKASMEKEAIFSNRNKVGDYSLIPLLLLYSTLVINQKQNGKQKVAFQLKYAMSLFTINR